MGVKGIKGEGGWFGVEGRWEGGCEIREMAIEIGEIWSGGLDFLKVLFEIF